MDIATPLTDNKPNPAGGDYVFDDDTDPNFGPGNPRRPGDADAENRDISDQDQPGLPGYLPPGIDNGPGATPPPGGDVDPGSTRSAEETGQGGDPYDENKKKGGAWND